MGGMLRSQGARWGNWLSIARARGLVALALAAVAVLALAACDRAGQGTPPPPSGEALQATRTPVRGFGLLRAYPDQHRNALAIVLEFSRPLVGTQDFDQLLTFAEPMARDGGWSLDKDGTTLRYPFVKPNTTYTLRVSSRLTAADGTLLGRDLEQKVFTGELDPAVGFASQGSILPARESRGLPVISVNVTEVDVEFLRVNDASLPKFFADYQRGGRKGSWELNHDYDGRKPLSQLATAVYVNRFVLGGKRNERVVTHLPLQDIAELQEPGLYFAVMKKAGSFEGEFETAFFTVSDIGLHARAYKDKLFVHAASLRDGSPLNMVELRILDARGEAILKGTTDRHGNVLLNYALSSGQVLVASKGSDVTLLPFNQPALDLSEFAVAGRQPAWFDVFAWSGRDLYRPGETVRVSALFRDNDGKPVALAGKAAQPLFVRLRQPDGKTLVESRVEPGRLGYFSFEKVIPLDAPTGRWQVEFRTDPGSREAVQGMTLRVEEFLPERMKLELAPAHAVLRPGQPLRIEATGAYLYGAPAAGNRFTAKLAVAVEQHPLELLPGYFFGDPTLVLPKEARDVVDVALDGNGQVRQDIALPREARPVSPIAAVVSGSVFETGGRSVNRSIKAVMWPAGALVGVRPLFDDKDGADANGSARFELVRVDSAGRPQPLKGLKATLVREHRDYHWDYGDDGWDHDFTRRYENVDTRAIEALATAVRFEFPVEWGDYRLDVHDPATGLTMRYPFRAGWGWDDDNRGLDARPDKVKLALDRTGYRAGGTMKVTVTPPHPGRGLLMVESDRLLYVQPVDVRAGSTFEIPVTADWERHDVYVTVLVFRGGSAVDKVTPARAVGVAHVPIDRRAQRVAVGVATPRLMRPGRAMPVTVSVPALAGSEAYVTVSAVDVGILNITRFPVPDANAHFFAQRRLGVDAYDVYGRVIESLEGSTARIRFGGDMPLAALPQARRPTSRVQTVDLFSGPVRLDGKGLARIDLAVPDFNGTLRVSALAFSGNRYGNRDSATVVRAPIVAEASMPRVLAPGDRSMVTLDLTNFTGKPGAFKVRVEGVGPLAIAEGTRTTAVLPAAGKATLAFPVTAREGYSTARVRVRVEGNGFKVDRSHDLPVRPGWPMVLRSRAQVLAGATPVALDADAAEGLMPGSVTARMSVSALPPIPFASALEGALDYPYGCAEQTTSKGYAALLLDPGTATLLGARGLAGDRRRQRMEGTFGRLASMQLASGHFSMWGGDGDVSPALTPYIVEFLLDARDGGFQVPEAVLQKALQRLSDDLLSGGHGFHGQDHRTHLQFAYRAHAGYVLARVNRAPLGTLRAMHDEAAKGVLTGLPLVHLGLGLSLQGDPRRGRKAIDAGLAFKGDRPGYLGDYGSPLRDAALMVALTHERRLPSASSDPRVVEIGRELDSRRRAGSLYLSTQEQVALARLGKALMSAEDKRVSGTLRLGSVEEPVAPARLVARSFDFAQLAQGVRFTPQGVPPFYAGLDVAGVPRRAPEPDATHVKVERQWYGTNGKPWRAGPLAEGEALIVGVRMTADRDMPDALLTDLLPAGLEIENFNLGDAKTWADVVVDGIAISDRGEAANLRHEEFREDRYVAALHLHAGRTARVFYLVRAVTPGTYTSPPPLVEDMYRPELRGVGRALPASITVVPP